MGKTKTIRRRSLDEQREFHAKKVREIDERMAVGSSRDLKWLAYAARRLEKIDEDELAVAMLEIQAYVSRKTDAVMRAKQGPTLFEVDGASVVKE